MTTLDEGTAVATETDAVAAAAVGRRARSAAPAGGYRALKRGIDVIVAVALLVLASPLLAIAVVAIRLSSPGPVLFRQRRIGRWSEEFVILKFRSMKFGTPDLASHLVGPGSGHVTAVGQWPTPIRPCRTRGRRHDDRSGLRPRTGWRPVRSPRASHAIPDRPGSPATGRGRAGYHPSAGDAPDDRGATRLGGP